MKEETATERWLDTELQATGAVYTNQPTHHDGKQHLLQCCPGVQKTTGDMFASRLFSACCLEILLCSIYKLHIFLHYIIVILLYTKVK